MKRAILLPFILIAALLFSATSCSKADDSVTPSVEKPTKPADARPLEATALMDNS